MISEALQTGIVETHRQIGRIFIDIAWKLVWLVATGALIVSWGLWIYWELGTIELDAPASAFRNPVAAMMLARELWNAYATTFFVTVFGLVLTTLIVWVVLESYFRAGIFSISHQPFFKSAANCFSRFLVLSCAKLVLAGQVIGILLIIVFRRFFVTPFAQWRELWFESRAPFTVCVVIFAMLWFFLTTFQTLARANSLGLLGPYLFEIVAAFAGLWLFEWMVFSTVVIGVFVLAAVLPVSSLFFLVVTVLSVLPVLVFLQSYLAVVRFEFVSVLHASRDLL